MRQTIIPKTLSDDFGSGYTEVFFRLGGTSYTMFPFTSKNALVKTPNGTQTIPVVDNQFVHDGMVFTLRTVSQKELAPGIYIEGGFIVTVEPQE